VLVAGAAVAIILTRGDHTRSIVSELTVASSTTPTATTTPATATTPPPSAPRRPVQTTPGNLLANGDFERDLIGWGPSGGGLVDRVAVGHSGAWSVRIRAVGPPPQPTRTGQEQPGILAAQAVQGRVGRSYEASAWVRASRPGIGAVLKLRELGGDGESADVIGVILVDADWHELAVIHQVHQAGGRLTVEAAATNLRPGEALLLDQVSITAP
jgi:Carbohydrate binding domain